MAHGDDAGLVVPPRIAPYLAVVIPVRDDEEVLAASAKIATELSEAGLRQYLDRGRGNFGRRVTDWEIKGVPLRIEVGPRDLAEGRVTIARRDSGEKIPVALSDVVATVRKMETEIHDALYARAVAHRDERTHNVSSIAEAINAAQEGFARLPWTVAAAGEAELKTHAITVRCLQREDGSLPDREDEPGLTALVAKSY
jgi:prolyl-tRNA synthetase